jgi:serine/threonine protein phosphatase PrpC
MFVSLIFFEKYSVLILFFVDLALDKDNQDCFTVSPSFGPTSENQAFFAVFDGHGKEGHHCARYARDHVSLRFAFHPLV